MQLPVIRSVFLLRGNAHEMSAEKTRNGGSTSVALGTAYSETCSLLSMQMAQVLASPSEIMPNGLLRTSQLNSRCAFVST